MIPLWKSWYKFLLTIFSLSVIDVGLIVDMVIQKCFAYYFEEPMWYRTLYPYVLHPIKGIFLNASIFMVVAVSAERFRAICYPFSNNQVSEFLCWYVYTKCTNFRTMLILIRYIIALHFYEQSPHKYATVVLSISIALKIPRFFHFRMNDEGTDYITTELMENTVYIWINAYWDDVMVSGFVPLIILVYFNIRIYLKASK